MTGFMKPNLRNIPTPMFDGSLLDQQLRRFVRVDGFRIYGSHFGSAGSLADAFLELAGSSTHPRFPGSAA